MVDGSILMVDKNHCLFILEIVSRFLLTTGSQIKEYDEILDKYHFM
jgi:hypothetical protein